MYIYLVKIKSSGTRNVLLLSTMNPLLDTVKEGRQPKPAICKLYDFTKAGTDNIDQRIGYYTYTPKSPRWKMTARSYMHARHLSSEYIHSRDNERGKETKCARYISVWLGVGQGSCSSFHSGQATELFEFGHTTENPASSW